MNCKTLVGLFAAGVGLLSSGTCGAVEFHMSPTGDDRGDGSAARPVKTLKRAVALLRAVERDEPKTVVVADGFYPFDEPVVLGKDDFDVTIRAEHSGKAVFSGGVPVKGWRKDDVNEKLLVADLPFEPKDGMRLAFVAGGRWCDIAAYPSFPNGPTMKLKSNEGTTAFAYDEDIDFSDVDFTSAWLIIPQEWSTCVSFVKSHDVEHKTFELKTPVGMKFSQFNQGFRILNSRHGLRQPGMWMYEKAKKRIVYWPREGETAENLVATLSKSHAILSLSQTVNTRVEGLVFEGCASDPAFSNPYDKTPNGAIALQYSSRVVIDSCEVRNCAGPGVFGLKNNRCVVTRSHVHHMGAECINYFDGGDACDVTWCDIHDPGLLGVTMGLGIQLSNSHCVGNKIHDCPACGAVMWSANSVFASNELWRCMFASRDGGGLYGGFNNSVLHDNYVHDIGNWSGLYADEGSQHVVFRNNRFDNCWWPIHLHCTQYVTVSNNVFKNDGAFRWSFQSSGHGVFCDNKVYTKEKPTDDPYRNNCDFWGRNEFFLKQADGSYKSAGELTLLRDKAKPETFDLPAVPENAPLPIRDRKPADWDAFIKPNRWSGAASVSPDGYRSIGVPDAGAYLCYDDIYLYVSIVRRWNALCGYPGMKNPAGTRWGHCDAARLSFEGGRSLTVFPNGTFETAGKMHKPGKDDLVCRGDGSFMVRIPLGSLDIKGSKQEQVKLDLNVEDDGLMLTDEAAEAERGPTKKQPKPQKVLGCSLKFNATIWVEDLREEKSLFAPEGSDYATGTIRFVATKKVR